MSDGDFIISVHALERFEERFPEVYKSDDETGVLIHEECQDAMEKGRVSTVAPLELAHHDLDRWQAGRCFYAWTPTKHRGYVLSEERQSDITVITVLKGKTPEEARRMLYEGRRPRKEEENEDPRNEPVAS